MTEYWQEKRLTARDVVYAWVLVLAIFAGVLLISGLTVIPCLDLGPAGVTASACGEPADAKVSTAQRISQTPDRPSRR